MNGRRIVSLFGLAVLLFSALPWVTLSTTERQDALDKIEPLVLEQVRATGPADFFVWMKEKADLSPAAQLRTKLEKGQFVFRTLTATAERTQGALRSYLDRQGVQYQSFYIANKVLVLSGSETLLMELAAREDVGRVTANHEYQLPEPIKEPVVPHPESVEPNISFVKADQVWALGITGQGTVLAGNDSGLDVTHPAIARHYRGCLNPPACTLWDHNHNWWDAAGTYPAEPYDRWGQGTRNTGTMLGDDGVSNQIGMAPGAQTIHCKNMNDSGHGDDGTFSECYEWDLAPWDLTGANPEPDLAPDAVDNSWDYWGGGSPQFADEIAALQAAGILVEATAGNDGAACGTLRSPGDYEPVLTIGSVQHLDPFPGTILYSSSRGPSSLYPNDYFPDVMGPGEGVRSSVPGGDYQAWYGISTAGPHAAGLVGLMWSANPALRGQVRITQDLIKMTAAPLTGQGGSGCGGDYTGGPNNDWGYGTIDSLAAVQAAMAYGGSGVLQGRVTEGTLQVPGYPIQDAQIEATLSPTLSWSVRSDQQGYYTMRVPGGTYAVDASRYGYAPVQYTGVGVISGTTTTQDIVMLPVPFYVVEGVVSDAGTGWPLYARIDIHGFPGGSVWTDPVSGHYRVVLASGITYTFSVQAWMGSYVSAGRYVGPLTGPRVEDFALQVDQDVCFAPGYGPQCVYHENFEDDNGGFSAVGNTSWEWGKPTSGPGRARSGSNVWATNLDGDYSTGESGYAQSPDIDLSALAGQGLVVSWWQWLQIAPYLTGYASVQVSKNGGNTWTVVYGPENGYVDRVWAQHQLFLDPSYAVADFRIRFFLDGGLMNTAPGFYVDDLCIVSVTPPTNVYSQGFDSDNGGYTSGGTNSSWAWGAPTSGPGSAHSLPNVWATNPWGNYNSNEDSWVESPDIDLSPYAGSGIYLSWWDWLARQSYGDYGEVLVSRDGGSSWAAVWGGPTHGDAAQWEQPTAVLDPSYAVANFRIRFHLHSDSYGEDAGFYVDDVAVAVGEAVHVLCAPDPGGLVVGNVYDRNTMDSLPGARVVDDGGGAAAALATPDDPRVGDAFYTLFAPPGEHVFTATVARPYGPDIEGVTVVQSATVGQDFYLPAGWLQAEPQSLAVTVDWGMSATLPLSLSNGGGCLLNWAYAERDRGWRPLLRQSGWVEYLPAAEADTEGAIHNGPLAGGGSAESPYVYHGWAPQAISIIVYSDDGQHRPDPVEQALQYLGLTYTHYGNPGEPGGLDEWAQSVAAGGWDLAILAQDSAGYLDAREYTALQGHIANGGLAIVHSWLVGYDWVQREHPLWAEMGMEYASWVTTTASLYWWEPDHPLFTSPDSVPEFTDLTDLGYGAYGARMRLLGESAAAQGGFSTTPSDGTAGIVLRDDFKTLYKGLTDNLNSADQDGDGTLDATEWWVNALSFIQNPEAEASWLFEEPVSGTLAAGAGQATSVTVDAGYVNQPGDYYATLYAKSDTPYEPRQVLVTMTVTPPGDMGKVAGMVSDHCSGAPMEATVTFVGGVPLTRTQSNESGFYSSWLVAGTYPVVFSAEGYVEYGTAVDVVPGVTATLDVIMTPDRACIAAAPPSFEVWVLTGTQDVRVQTLTDRGGRDLAYEYREVTGGYNPTPRHAGTPIVGSVPAVLPANPQAYYGPPSADFVPPAIETPPAIEGAWESRAPSPFLSSDSAYVEYGGLIYLVGGYGADGGVGIYDPVADSWTAGASEPHPYIEGPTDGCLGLNSSGDPVIVLFPDAMSISGELHLYSIATNSWYTTTTPAGFPGNGFWGHDIVSLLQHTGENVCYLSGGYTGSGTNVSTLWAYSPGSNTVVNLGDFTLHPVGFSHHASWYVPWVGTGAICVGGGIDAVSFGVFPDTQCYDLASGTFNAPNADLGPMPEAVWGTADGFLVENGDYELWVANGMDADVNIWQHSMYYNPWSGRWFYGPDPAYRVFRVEGETASDGNGCHFYVANGERGVVWPSDFHERNVSPECPELGKVDVPWLWEEPVSGTVLAGSTSEVEIGFTSFYTAVPTGTVVHLPLGTHTALLRLKNNDPTVWTAAVPVTMHVVAEFLAPRASFSTTSPVCLGLAMAFTNTSTGGVPPASAYQWAFGDGVTSTLESPVHTYSAAGTYTVTLEACNDKDLCDTASSAVEVLALPLPVADFTFVAHLLTVTFTNASTNTDRYRWDFGDGMTSTLVSPVHRYAAAGTYVVTLTATGVCGADTAAAAVTASLPPIYLPLIYRARMP